MLTLPGKIEVIRDERPAYRPYRATVSRVVRLSPHFTRVTFTGPDFETFGTDGFDQRIKLLLPLADGTVSDVGADDPHAIAAGSWYERWRALPDHARSPFRTYTVRAIRPLERELDVDFVAHGDGGPAARWLLGCAVGHELIIVGPDARSIHSAVGIDWHPGTATEVLLVGDETAAPAICSILESLPAGVVARAFIEIEDVADALDVRTTGAVTLTWLARNGAATGTVVESAVRDWVRDHGSALTIAPARQDLEDIDVDVELLWDSPEEAPGGHFYAWLAGESAMIKSLRRFLVSEVGVDRRRVAFMGYWRHGKSEAQ
jgi:NADPH-dependent ferric siderophore reductase